MSNGGVRAGEHGHRNISEAEKKGVVDEVQCRSGGHTYGFLLGMPSLQDNTAVSTKLSKESGHYCYI